MDVDGIFCALCFPNAMLKAWCALIFCGLFIFGRNCFSEKLKILKCLYFHFFSCHSTLRWWPISILECRDQLCFIKMSRVILCSPSKGFWLVWSLARIFGKEVLQDLLKKKVLGCLYFLKIDSDADNSQACIMFDAWIHWLTISSA